MYWLEFLYGFEFEHQLFFHDDIEPITGVEWHFLVNNRQFQLPLKVNLSKPEFMAKAGLIGRLEQSWSERTMNLDRCADDPVGQRISLCLCVSVVKGFCIHR